MPVCQPIGALACRAYAAARPSEPPAELGGRIFTPEGGASRQMPVLETPATRIGLRAGGARRCHRPFRLRTSRPGPPRPIAGRHRWISRTNPDAGALRHRTSVHHGG